VTSFEVCPSRVRITRRLSYTELDDLLAREENTGRVVESLLSAAPADKGDGDGEFRVASGAVQTQGEGSLSRGYLGVYSVCVCVCEFVLASLFFTLLVFTESRHPLVSIPIFNLLCPLPPLIIALNDSFFAVISTFLQPSFPHTHPPSNPPNALISFIFLFLRFFYES
jgi:hypothetical protein